MNRESLFTRKEQADNAMVETLSYIESLSEALLCHVQESACLSKEQSLDIKKKFKNTLYRMEDVV